jgi:hypothetical protein
MTAEESPTLNPPPAPGFRYNAFVPTARERIKQDTSHKERFHE